VTLFANADSVTAAELDPCDPIAYGARAVAIGRTGASDLDFAQTATQVTAIEPPIEFNPHNA
jgi:hypothetical protein